MSINDYIGDPESAARDAFARSMHTPPPMRNLGACACYVVSRYRGDASYGKILGVGPNETAAVAFSTQGRDDRGEVPVGELVAMRRPTPVPLDPMKLPLTLAGGLRTTFADVVLIPLPGRLAALMRRVDADRNKLSGEGLDYGPSATRTSSRIDR